MQAYGSTFKLVADTELIANRLYAALNLIYEPEVAKPADTGMWERSSSAGLGAGLLPHHPDIRDGRRGGIRSCL